jgi:hypothetical protein
VQACPHDNVALGLRVPGAELTDVRRRSGIGRLSRRPDIRSAGRRVRLRGPDECVWHGRPCSRRRTVALAILGTSSEAPALAALYAIGLCAWPAAMIYGASALTQLSGHGPGLTDTDGDRVRVRPHPIRVRHMDRSLSVCTSSPVR